ncbi:serine/arginine repetitive matrix protein 2 [Salvelinus namaycush]|uniref:Serine/arginine repetitive matrix protein 2 n=1 Tax=Salvelinus namaycush TaxID=8040 RepID=A0A8U0U9F2_SALNM|nr:serine/arginine repetitive matrix protein 2 [Salvelinus namaycush]
MPLSGDDLICPKFQPTIFDSSRCHDCLRQKHLHSDTSTGTGTAETPQQSLTVEKEPGQATGPPPTLLPAPQAVERDASAKTEGEGIRRVEDSDGLSVVSSYCDVSGDQLGYEESSLCILSPDCDLYICDGDNDSTDSCRDQSVYADLSGSISAEDDYLPLRHRSTHLTMTRLDPPPHRTNPKAWMEEDNSRGRIGRHSGLKEERNRESGYFSLGRAGGARSLRDQSPPPVYRHSERGHPLYSNRSPEPKATIPFRNPNLGLASERLNPEILNPDLPLEIPEPPDAFDLTIEVEAQVGPRSPSPTPFKIAESLASTNRRGFNSSYSRRNSPSYQESGKLNSSRQSSSLSRSSSPLRNTSPFKRSECTTSLNRWGLDSEGWSQGRGFDTPCQFLLCKSETRGYGNGRGRDSGSSSPSRKGYDAPSQSPLRKSESNSYLNSQSRDSRSSSPLRKGYDAPGQSLLCKSETNSSVRSQSRDRPTSSPSRRGYDTPSQSSLRKSESKNYLNSQSRDSRSSSPLRKGYDAPGQSLLCKSETNSSVRCQSRGSRSSSPSRRGHDTPSQSLLHKSEKSGALNGRSRDSRNSSPSKRGNDPPGQSLLRKTTSGGDSSLSYQRKNPYGDARPDSNPSPGAWRGSTHFLHSTSPSREGRENKTSAPSQRASAVTWETTWSSSSRQGLETRSSSPNTKGLTNRNLSPSPQMQRHTSSQSSMESSESGQLSGESTERSREEYAMMADLPKVKPVLQKEQHGHVGQTPNQPSGRQELFKPASHSLSKHPSREWLDDSGDLERNHIEWQNGSSGRLSRVHSSTSLHMQG